VIGTLINWGLQSIIPTSPNICESVGTPAEAWGGVPSQSVSFRNHGHPSSPPQRQGSGQILAPLAVMQGTLLPIAVRGAYEGQEGQTPSTQRPYHVP
jgi:hypothetical protein